MSAPSPFYANKIESNWMHFCLDIDQGTHQYQNISHCKVFSLVDCHFEGYVWYFSATVCMMFLKRLGKYSIKYLVSVQCTYIRAASLYTAYLEKFNTWDLKYGFIFVVGGCVYKPSDPVDDFEKPVLLFKSHVEKIYFRIKTYQPNWTSSNKFWTLIAWLNTGAVFFLFLT
jgi:hypothetical protein